MEIGEGQYAQPRDATLYFSLCDLTTRLKISILRLKHP